MILQLWAAGGATVLAVRDRFDRIAFAYIAGAVAGLVVYLAVSGSRRRALARLVDAGDGGRHLRRRCSTASAASAAASPRLAERAAGLRRLGALRLASSSAAPPIYLAFNGLYVITLAFASNYDAGDATVLSYAYLFASYLVAATGFALGMSRIADMRRGALADWREVIADTVPAGFRYAMLLVAPALAALIAGGATLIGRGPALQLRRVPGRAAAGLRRAARAPGRSRRCSSTCCCRRCSRSAGPSSSTRWRR